MCPFKKRGIFKMESNMNWTLLSELKILNLFGFQVQKINNSHWSILDSNGIVAGTIIIANVVSENPQQKIHMLVDYGNMKSDTLRDIKDTSCSYKFSIEVEDGVAEISIRLNEKPKLTVKFNDNLVSTFELSDNYLKLYYQASTKDKKEEYTTFFHTSKPHDGFFRESVYVTKHVSTDKTSGERSSQELGAYQQDINTLELVSNQQKKGRKHSKKQTVDGDILELVKQHDDSLEVFRRYKGIVRDALPFKQDIIKLMFKQCRLRHPVMYSLLKSESKKMQ